MPSDPIFDELRSILESCLQEAECSPRARRSIQAALAKISEAGL